MPKMPTLPGMKNSNKEDSTRKRRGGKSPIMEPTNPFWNNVVSAFLIFLIIMGGYSMLADKKSDPAETTLSALVADIKAGSIREITVEGEEITALYREGEEKKIKKETGTAFSDTLVNYGVDLGAESAPTINVKNESGLGFWLLNLAPIILPLLIIGVILWILTKQVKGAGVQALSFGQSRARMIDPNDKKQKVTFKDVAGVKEAKQELLEIVDFLRNPKKFLDIGARIPKGVLLMGAPGTGKTLLARAVAGEANVPFFSISGSEFVEMFVGVGASRVRDLFKMAKRMAPAIIFIDEIDAVGRARGAGMGGGNDEREQTLNQILVEMDGFEPNEKVIVVAATNRPDVLDPALLRPGRFDRRVTIDSPDLDDREAILKIQIAQKPLEKNVNVRRLAERTPGFTGADLYSLVNEGAILAAREDKKKIEQRHLIDAIEKVMLGPERKSHLLSKEEKNITAYHEAGHAVVGSVLEHTDPVHKISVVARGRAAGYVLHMPLEEKKFRSRKQFIDELSMALGGYVAEKLIFKDLTTGPSSDLQTATARARDMVTKYGMSEKIGPIALETEDGRVLYGASGEREYSQTVAAQVDAEVAKFMQDAQKRALQTIKTHRKLLDAIALKLMKQETIERDEFEDMLTKFKVKVKKAPNKAGVVIAENVTESK